MKIGWSPRLKEDSQPTFLPSASSDLLDRRGQARFKIEVEVSIDSKSCGLLKGHTVDISESGISAMVRLELPVGELVELDFTLPFGRVTIYAVVRQRSAFRYGFRFAESNFIENVVRPTCRVLAMQQRVSGEI
jgi:PilZ domain